MTKSRHAAPEKHTPVVLNPAALQPARWAARADLSLREWCFIEARDSRGLRAIHLVDLAIMYPYAPRFEEL